MTSRPRGVKRRWRLSRIVFRQLADHNQMCGIQRARWWWIELQLDWFIRIIWRTSSYIQMCFGLLMWWVFFGFQQWGDTTITPRPRARNVMVIKVNLLVWLLHIFCCFFYFLCCAGLDYFILITAFHHLMFVLPLLILALPGFSVKSSKYIFTKYDTATETNIHEYCCTQKCKNKYCYEWKAFAVHCKFHAKTSSFHSFITIQVWNT